MSKRSELMKELTAVFNYWIKLKEANSNDMVRCFTCDKVCHISGVDAGHFQGSKKMTTRWNEMNVKPQCRECNSKENGMREEFARRLDELYGYGTAEQIELMSNTTKKISNNDLKDLIRYYQDSILSFS